MEATLQQQLQHRTQQPQGAAQTAGIQRQFPHQQMNMRGIDNIEMSLGGQEQWENWSWDQDGRVRDERGIGGNIERGCDARSQDHGGDLEEGRAC